MLLDYDDQGQTIATVRNQYGSLSDAAELSLDSGFITFNTGASFTERARLDANGNLLVGKTSPDTDTVGHELRTGGVATHTSDAAPTLYLNRKTSDGAIAEFRKDGTSVGNIGTGNSGNLYLGSGDTGINFNADINSVYPINPSNGAASNGAIDLGYGGIAFKDLYLSGATKYGTSVTFATVAPSGENLVFTANAGQANVSPNFIFNASASGSAVTERMRIDASGNLLVGVTTGSNRLQVRGAGSAAIFSFETEQPATAIYGAAATLAVASGENLTNSMLYLRKDLTTNRSINAAGTINASGADYAEYEQNNGLAISKGTLVGFKTDGTLTLTFNEAVRFAIKSTDPALVGGDVWGIENQIGAKPEAPAEDADQATIDQYEADIAAFEAALEAARQLVDRIAYSGKVPVNIQGATAGDYIIAVAADDGSIDGQAVSDPDFSQYKLSVGRVNRILDDGRAEVAVIIH